MGRLLQKPWHESFLDCVSPHTDAPDKFVFWGAISLIGAAMRNHTYIDIGTFRLFPNQFVVFVAPPGVGKGTVMALVEELNAEIKPNPVINTLSDRITAEKIIETIADGWDTGLQFVNQQIVPQTKDHSCLLFSSEIRVLLGASDWMLEFLEEAWSKTSFNYQTKNKGSVKCTDMCCSLLAASVPDFLRNVNKEVHMVITGGFSSRCLFIHADKPSKDLPFPEPLKKNKHSKGLYDKLIEDLKVIASLKGEFSINPEARMIFEDFLKTNRKLAEDDELEAVINFRARIKAHVLKLAMAFSASRSDTLVINKFDMSNAIAEARKVGVALNKLFRGVGDSADAENASRVQEIIEKAGMVTKKELVRKLRRHCTVEALERILYTLVFIGFCETVESSKMTFYKHTPGNMKKQPAVTPTPTTGGGGTP